jgi:excisionase family DNA binding protein
MEDRLYTTQEVAKELSVSDAHIRRMIGQGKAQPKQQIGGTWLFTLEEIERLRNRPKSKGGRPKK